MTHAGQVDPYSRAQVAHDVGRSPLNLEGMTAAGNTKCTDSPSVDMPSSARPYVG
jgi:hypothetical protein